MTHLGLTPSQTVGPFFSFGLPWSDGPYAVPEGTPDAVWLRGRVFDGAGDLVPDALLETWQSEPGVGRGFARAATDAEGAFAILFVKPGAVPGPDGSTQAPHLALSVFARGLLDRVVTRVYFDDEAKANLDDPVLNLVPPELRDTLISVRAADGYTLDIRLQGQGETVFLDI